MSENILGMEGLLDRIAPQDDALYRCYCAVDSCVWEEWATREAAMNDHCAVHALLTGHDSFDCEVDTYSMSECTVTLSVGEPETETDE